MTLTLGFQENNHALFFLEFDLDPFGKGIIMLLWGPLNAIFMEFSGSDSVSTPIKLV